MSLSKPKLNRNRDKARLKKLRISESKHANETLDMNGIKAMPPPKLD